ncbi:YjfB family protein [Anaeromicrobium sediminis]|uniref:Motility protein n=1 Tax=Anaeromicrobium sediminis TaxID=1478221 RepID=A0A267MGD2_9FIRM|nr:YjfB family protein [Anaeromicrobium sediminis]PAB58527.1 hypothetical protein CCE28_14575 [Anaeromicrobium sediminis]
MDVGSLSMAMSQASLSQQVSLSVAKMTMDTAEVSSANMVKMMEQSVNPSVGSNLDIKL